MFNIEFALFLALEGQILLSINCFRDEKHCWLNENENTRGGSMWELASEELDSRHGSATDS